MARECVQAHLARTSCVPMFILCNTFYVQICTNGLSTEVSYYKYCWFFIYFFKNFSHEYIKPYNKDSILYKQLKTEILTLNFVFATVA